MHAFLLALLATGVAAFGSLPALPAADPGNPCLDPKDFVKTNSLDAPHCEEGAVVATYAACEAAGCNWRLDEGKNDDPCECDSEQLCESAAVGGTWTPRSLTCGFLTEQALGASWTCASNPGEMLWFAGGCCSGGAASTKCICGTPDTPDCAFNPCMDPKDFVPDNLIPADHCVGDEPSNPIAATQAACEAAGCKWDGGNTNSDGNDPCLCESEQVCESTAVGGTWTPRSFTCGGSVIQNPSNGGSSWWTCANLAQMGPSAMTATADPCCSGAVQLPECA